MEQTLTVGDVINGTIRVVTDNKEAAIVYLAGFTLLGTALEWGSVQALGQEALELPESGWLLDLFGIGAGFAGLILLIVSIVGQYLLWEAMLRRADGLATAGHRRILAFVGLSILVGLAVAFGYLLLIIPGLIFAARWAAAPAYLIGEGQGVIDAMNSSWERQRGNTTPVVLAMVAAGVLFIVVFGSISLTLGGGFDAVVGLDAAGGAPGLGVTLLGQFTTHLATVLGIGLGSFLFAALRGPSKALSNVFE